MAWPLGPGNGRLSGYSDSRNWPFGLQAVATEPDAAKQPDSGRARGEKKERRKFDKRELKRGGNGKKGTERESSQKNKMDSTIVVKLKRKRFF